MGCNFYWNSDNKHIGKRSATGPYCYNCGIQISTFPRHSLDLCLINQFGKLRIRNWIGRILAKSEKFGQKVLTKKLWCRVKLIGGQIACPVCGANYIDEPIPVATALELGFSEKPLQFTKGLCSSSRFTFAQNPTQILLRLRCGNTVVDEYGRKYTPDEFHQVIAGCVIQNFDLIGREFC